MTVLQAKRLLRAIVALVAVSGTAGCGVTGTSSSPRPSLGTGTPSSSAGPTTVPSPTSTFTPTGTFVATGNMTHPRMDASATLLADGRVLIVGGEDYIGVPVFQYVASAELYDPSTRKFTRTGSMTVPRANAAATRLMDGRVLVMGGNGCFNPARCTMRNWAGGIALKSAEIYDPTSGRFTSTGSMADARSDAFTSLLPDGRVLVLSSYSRLVEAYNAATGRFARAGTLLNDYRQVRAVRLPDSKVLVVGESDGLRGELFDPATGTSKSVSLGPLGEYSSEAHLMSMTSLSDGRVLVNFWGGDLWVCDVETAKFKYVGVADWEPPVATLLQNGTVLFTGGDLIAPSDMAAVYDPASGFHVLKAAMIEARARQTMTALSDGTVLIAGGLLLGDPNPISAELFVP